MDRRRARLDELDTVARCGGSLDDLHLWMLDGVDIRADWKNSERLKIAAPTLF